MKRFYSIFPIYKIFIIYVSILTLNCGLALGYQAEEEAAKVSQENDNSSVLAALGLSSGGAGGSTSTILGFNPSTLSFSAASGKGLYSIVLASWPGGASGTTVVGLNLGMQAQAAPPGGGSGDFTFEIQWTGNPSCLAPSQTFTVASDDLFPLTLGGGGISFSCSLKTSGLFKHVIITSNGDGLPVGTDIGDLQVNVQ
ncbi:hypothetical protein EHO58_09110 [Leptospira selangorensis]|uniref:hypothetical protein n=1 Tax=Leptospira selangorensis TaxID=2484982 RepID=UPI0010823FAF|nr:hypothetical protein [Leptospira selangorensis]TGK05912.1 hypothetical protein EHO58_09110 [Leptospira selangorensis]